MLLFRFKSFCLCQKKTIVLIQILWSFCFVSSFTQKDLNRALRKQSGGLFLARRVYDTFNYDTRRNKRGVSFRKMMIFCPCQSKNGLNTAFKPFFFAIFCLLRGHNLVFGVPAWSSKQSFLFHNRHKRHIE